MKKLFIIVVILFLCSCKKETIDQTPQLLSKSWKITAMNVLTPLKGTPLEGLSTNWYAPSGCRFKQIWTLNPSGTLEIKDDPICIIASAQSSSAGTWNLSNNNSKINITNGWYGNFTYSLVNLTDTKFTVQRNEVSGIGGLQNMNLLIEYEFSAQ